MKNQNVLHEESTFKSVYFIICMRAEYADTRIQQESGVARYTSMCM